MRAYLPAYELKVPASLDEALALLESEPGVWRPFAGGTDLMVLLEAGNLAHRKFFSLWNLAELKGIEETAEQITLGGLTTYTEIQANATLQKEFPMLCRAASETGAIAIQNRGTLAGNIANASPAADSPPALLVYDAQIELISASRGARWIPYKGFHTDYKQTVMSDDEIIRRIRLPRAMQGWRPFYRKVGTRKAQAISKTCFAGAAQMEANQIKAVRIALGSVAPLPLRCVKTEATLRGQHLDEKLIQAARDELSREISPIDDIRSTADYRLQVTLNLLEDFLLRLKA